MKNLVELFRWKNIIHLVVIQVLVTSTSHHYGQESSDTISPSIDIKTDLSIPDFQISTIKDSTNFSSKSLSKDGLVLIMYFSPDCQHCQEEAELFVSKRDSLNNIRSIWISGVWAELKMITEFAVKYNLKALNPIAIGKETTGHLLTYYDLQGVPYAAVYKDNRLLREYHGALDFNELILINNGSFISEPTETSRQKEQNKPGLKGKN